MRQELFYTSFRAAIGLVQVVWDSKGLLFISFPDMPENDLLREAKKRFGIAPTKGESPAGKAVELLKRYFSGEEVDFSGIPLDLAQGTSFQQTVWKKLMEIPYGEVRSYGWVAREVGCARAVRAVGRACGQNPLPPIVPCHRVVGSRGELKGYSGPGGVSLKKTLLELEGANITSVGAGFTPAHFTPC
ncbi:MAG TPA: methylated-DNA--[protein]-cysteine S-methyltransferase [Candidatus Hypogeohydataceae bacterium YC41]